MYTAPAISAGFGAIVYLLIKYIVLVRKDPTRWGLYTAPFFFFTLTAVLTLSISKYDLLEHGFIISTSTTQFIRVLLRSDLPSLNLMLWLLPLSALLL